MRLFKVIFDHDLRLKDLLEPPADAQDRNDPNPAQAAASLEEFLKPDPTYSRLYLSGTRLDEELFGFDTLPESGDILGILQRNLPVHTVATAKGPRDPLSKALTEIQPGQALILQRDASETIFPDQVRALHLHSSEEPLARRKALGRMLEKGHVVVFKEQAHHGYDLHIYSLINLYPLLFQDLKTLIAGSPDIRFFSINAKRMRSERMFYFEMWTLDRPPHGFEEVFPESVM